MTVTPLTFEAITLDWVTSFNEPVEIHTEAFVLYDGTTKYAPVENAGRTLNFGGVQKNLSNLTAMRTKIGSIGTVTYANGSNSSMTITDFDYTYRAFDGTSYYYDWILSFGQSQ